MQRKRSREAERERKKEWERLRKESKKKNNNLNSIEFLKSNFYYLINKWNVAEIKMWFFFSFFFSFHIHMNSFHFTFCETLLVKGNSIRKKRNEEISLKCYVASYVKMMECEIRKIFVNFLVNFFSIWVFFEFIMSLIWVYMMTLWFLMSLYDVYMQLFDFWWF